MSSRHIRGHLVFKNYLEKTAAGNIAAADLANVSLILVNKDSGAATAITLPTANYVGQTWIIVDAKGDAGTNNITITPASGNINGSATYTINENYESVILVWDGTNYTIVGSGAGSISAAESGYLDGVTAGTVTADKALVVDSAKQLNEFGLADDSLLKLGTGADVALVNRSTALTANTALTGVLVGTPVTPAVAANSFVLGNVTADGDILLAGQTGGNSHAVFFADLSAGTTSIMVAGVAVARFDSTDVLFPDDYILTIGTGCSVAYKDDATAANTAVTNVVLGTPVTPAVAADTLFICNQIADGDILIAGQTGGNTRAAILVDASAGTVTLYGAGVQMLSVDSTSVNIGVAGTTTGRIEISGATSGTISIIPLDAAGTYTLTLPPDDGDAGEQLQTDGSGVLTWEAAGSLRAVKNVLAEVSDRAEQVLQRLLGVGVYEFQYKPAGRPTTGDYRTVYTGVMAEELPEVMHHGGRIFSPVSAFGELLLAVKALARKVERLEAAA